MAFWGADEWEIVGGEENEQPVNLSYADFRNIVDRHTVSILAAPALDGEWVPVPTSDDLVAISKIPQETDTQILHWQRFLDGRDPTTIARSELRNEVFRGLTYQARQKLWVHWMRLEAPGRCPTRQKLDSLAKPTAQMIKQVALDVPRTFPNVLNDHDQRKLTKILHWYAGYRPEIGYCQSMNFIGAIFVLMGFEDAKCFAALRALIDDFCSRYHADDLSGFTRDAAVLDKLVSDLLPGMAAKLKELQVPIIWLAVDPFLCLFAKTLPLASLLRLWDVFLFEGPRALFASFIAFLEVHESYLQSSVKVPQSPDAAVQQIVAEFVSTQSSANMDRVLERTRQLLQHEVTNEVIKQYRIEVDSEQRSPTSGNCATAAAKAAVFKAHHTNPAPSYSAIAQGSSSSGVGMKKSM